MTESTASLLQVVFAGLTFLVFIGIAIVTYNYARYTKRMADTMNREFEFRCRPFVDVRIGLPHILEDYSGFKIPLELLLLAEFPFTVTKTELEIELVVDGKKKTLKLLLAIDRTLTKNDPKLKLCMGPFKHEAVLRCMEARRENPSAREPQIAAFYIYHRNIEGYEELFQRLPVPYRNYYELDKICSSQ